MPKPERIPPSSSAIEAEAARWVARHDSGLGAAEHAAFEAWVAADAAHAAAWARLEGSWRAFDRPHAAGVAGEMIAELRVRCRRRRWRITVGTTATLAVAAALAVLVAPPVKWPWAVPAASHANIVVRPATQALADGTVVELNTGAAIASEFTPARRVVHLTRGEAHFAVTKDASRPFVVAASGVEVRAVGTAFSVRVERGVVEVLVTEGRVAVARRAGSVRAPALTPGQAEPDDVLLDAGHQLSVAVAAAMAEASLIAAPVDAAGIAQRLAWRGPRLELSDTPLADAVAAFNRESHLQITVRGDGLRALRLNGVFRADNAEGFVRLLETHYGIGTEWRGTHEVVLRPAP